MDEDDDKDAFSGSITDFSIDNMTIAAVLFMGFRWVADVG
jgi:hypothetical protein